MFILHFCKPETFCIFRLLSTFYGRWSREQYRLTSISSISTTITFKLLTIKVYFQEIVKGDLVQMPYFFAVPFINGMIQVFSRSTLPRSEYHALWALSRGTVLFQRNSTDMGGALSLTPWLKDVLPNYSGYNSLVKGNQYLLDFFTVCIQLFFFIWLFFFYFNFEVETSKHLWAIFLI